MRLAPVALRFWNDRDELDRAAAEQSRTTHGAQAGVDRCRAFAAMLADAISGKPWREILSHTRSEGDGEIPRIMDGSWQGRSRYQIHSTGYVVPKLEAPLWSVARTGHFRSAVVLAANLADDADTVPAVTAQPAGATYGLSGIPKHWLDAVARKDRLLESAHRLPEPVARG
ncbi:MAG: ADP-ribosylglycohydrolase family protein [Gammaproteobacteria bacterium]|nr:ADP-ribosylglycohydrolase family protein [Gammaproteobacteria bacterium]MDE0248604.1 ADP-ribosylglycohydrolase family protein [Gammaproteobacteria bacterium]